jgi:hypothetical protein
MYRDNYIKALRAEMLEMVAEQLTPVALRYGYSDVPWRPPSSGGPRSSSWAATHPASRP